MKNAKSSLVGILAIALVIGAIMFDSSRTGRATPANTNSNKSEVVVVNNVDNPVISRVVGTTPVSIDPASNTVKIDSSTPVSVHDAGNPQPFSTAGGIRYTLFAGQVDVGFDLTQVPAGKRLVIETLTAQVFLPHGQHAILAISTQAGERPIPLPRSPVVYGDYDYFDASGLVKIYADSGNHLRLTIKRTGETDSAQVGVTIDGYLVDMPQ